MWLGFIACTSRVPCRHQLIRWLLLAAALQNFGEFGPVRHIHIVPAKTIAFIRFHWRVTAEFAREAMDQQQLTGSTLNEVGICWN